MSVANAGGVTMAHDAIRLSGLGVEQAQALAALLAAMKLMLLRVRFGRGIEKYRQCRGYHYGRKNCNNNEQYV